jgi:2-alkyl-3-oxoalkanoate reductase
VKCVVTGGTGFVGKALCLALKQKGHEVVALSRKRSTELVAAGVSSVELDIAKLQNEPLSKCAETDSLCEILKGTDCVFHVAAKVGMWGGFGSFYQTNVQATRALLRAAREQGAKAFIYTSSPSVIASGENLKGVDESAQYPKHYEAYYPMTKAMAERSVLEANAATCRTLALRPHLIWGPGDTNLVPTILERARQGRLLRIGSGENLVDFSFIDDCVNAHIKAFDCLMGDDSQAADAASGRAYFISQGEPTLLWGFIDEVLERNGISPLRRSLSHKVARVIAALCESLAGLSGGKEPLLTRFLVDEMATDHYFDISAAERYLGYKPSVSMAEAMDRTFSARRLQSAEMNTTFRTP